jgi:uncharacterized protein
MRGVFFDQRVATVARSPYRADVALFVGYVDRRRKKHVDPRLTGAAGDAVVEPIIGRRGPSAGLYRWLVAEHWARGVEETDRANGLDELLNIPVPIDSFETFDRLFAWEQRPLGAARAGEVCETYLGAAVRSFFVQGGRLCYVVRAGNPRIVPLSFDEATAEAVQRVARLRELVPLDPSPANDRATWTGVWAIYGLPDVSFVALPDLADLVRAPIAADTALPPLPVEEVGFVECSEPPGRPVDDQRVRSLLAPKSDDDGFTLWASTLDRLLGEISRVRAEGGLREVQLVAAIPRPTEDRTSGDLLAYLEPLLAGGLATSFLQLAYPWVGAAASALPEGIEPPEGVLCGVLAANALERGTYRSIGGRRLIDIVTAEPRPLRDVSDPSSTKTLAGRVTMLGRTPGGFEVLSDVTTSLEPTWRLGHASRLMASLSRALRVIGESSAFEASNERTWSDVRARISDVLREFWRVGALRGANETDAFVVRCDRTTMTQDDIDNGRLVAEITVDVTVSIQRLDVTLTRNGSRITLERAA